MTGRNKKSTDKLERKWGWARTQWEVAKELGLFDDSRTQPVMPLPPANYKIKPKAPKSQNRKP